MTLSQLILSDYRRVKPGKGMACAIRDALIAKERTIAYCFWYRIASRPGPLHLLGRVMHRHYSRRYGVDISHQCRIGPGLYLGHCLSIVVNRHTRIGSNCNLSQCTTIGSNHNTPATIGDNVYIGPGVSIVEDVTIGSNATIGAGATVVKSIPDNATAVGTPARVVNYDSPGRYIVNPWRT